MFGLKVFSEQLFKLSETYGYTVCMFCLTLLHHKCARAYSVCWRWGSRERGKLFI